MDYKKLFFFLSLIIYGLNAHAQEVLLFQMPSSDAQIEAAQSVNDMDAVKLYQRSDNQIKHAIAKDFRTNFTFCPIYFFHSKDLEKVENKNFSNVVFYDNNLNETSVPNAESYHIANISLFPKQTELVEKMNGEKVLEQTAESHFGLGIILRTMDYEAVDGKLRFTPCKIGKRGNIFNKKKRYYVFTGGYAFNRKMMKFFPELKTAE